MNETNVSRDIMLAIGAKCRDVRIFRNNVALAWVGKTISNKDGVLKLANARPLHAGLCPGSSDLIGWKKTTITPDMVGKEVAIFLAIEVKKSSKSTASEGQLNFLEQVKKNGGIGIITVTADEAIRLLEK